MAVSDHCHRHCGTPYNCLKPVSTSGIAAGIKLQFCTPAVFYIRVFCIMLDSNIRGSSAPPYILGLTTQITPCSPCPDAAATRVQSDLWPSLTGCRRWSWYIKIILVSCRVHASDYTHRISVGNCHPIANIRYHYRSDAMRVLVGDWWQVVSSWCVVVVLVLLAESVKDVSEILQCLLGCQSQCTAEELIDCLYCIAAFLFAFKSLRITDIWTQ